jgi:N-acetylmuramoyl-L-alanine amidase
MFKAILLSFLLLIHPMGLSEDTLQTDKTVVEYLDRDIECLAKVIYFEARGEGALGMLAVGHVVMNRIRHRDYPDDVCSVVYQKNQFSWTKTKHRIVSMTLYKKAESIAYDILTGDTKDPTRGATSFHASSVEPSWGKRIKTRIGNHIFY